MTRSKAGEARIPRCSRRASTTTCSTISAARSSVEGAEGRDQVHGIEHLQFADGAIAVAEDGTAVFDSYYYLSRNPDVFHAGVNALDHFNSFGRHEGRDPNAFFDTSGYLAVNQDVAAGGINPLEHYHRFGWQEGRDPSAASTPRSI